MKIKQKKNIANLNLVSVLANQLQGATILEIDRETEDFIYECGADEGLWSEAEDENAIGKTITNVDAAYMQEVNSIVLDLQLNGDKWLTISEYDNIRVKYK